MIADLPCVEFVELVTDYLDDAMPAAERQRLKAHLTECDGCTTVLEQFRTAIAFTGDLGADDVDAVDPATRDALLSTFRAWSAQRNG